MNVEKLTAIAEMLESMDAEDTTSRVYDGRNVRFDMSTWLARRAPDEPNEPCGFAACAIGHAVLAGILDDALVFVGLTSYGTEKELGPEPLVYLDAHEKPRNAFAVRHVDRDRWDAINPSAINAVAAALGVDWEVARFLFLPNQYRGAHESQTPPAAVAKRIRYILSGGDIEWWDAIRDQPVIERG